MALRLVKDRSEFYTRIKLNGSHPVNCRVWQTSPAGRVSLNTTALIDPSVDSLKITKEIKSDLDLTKPCYFFIENFDYAFKSQIDSDSSAIIPDTLCTQERRKKNRLYLKKGILLTFNFNGNIQEVELHDISQDGANFRASEFQGEKNLEIVITKLGEKKDNLNLKAKIKHITKFAKEPLTQESDGLEFFFSVGVELETPWPFEIESEFDSLTQIMDVKEKLFNLCMLSVQEKKIMEQEIEKIEGKIKNTRFANLLKAYTSEKNSAYIKWHTDVASFLSVTAARKLDWISEATIKKFILACYLHDLIFAEYPKLSEIQNKAEFELLQGQMSPREIFLFQNHPKLAASLANDQMDLSSDIEKILSQQKELPDGSGYPMGINHLKITPLSALFIICHDIAHYLYFNQDNNLKKYCTSLREKYKGQTFYKVTNALIELFPS
ncbi:MAG: HD domain-containing phosphohydrolase [Bacteriovoracaceae bacterium]